MKKINVILNLFNKYKFTYTVFLFLFTNLLFIDKYFSRQNYVPVIVVQLVFVVSFTFILKYLPKIEFSKIFYRNSFFSLVILYFLFTIFINQNVNGYSLNTDRWSSTHFAIKALLNGDYPYSATDHLNGRTSNLPILLLLNIPFYFLGDVGYFQSFFFLVFTFIIYKYLDNYKARFIGILLIIISISYYWEIYSKSDLLSNSILLLFSILFLFKKENYNSNNNIILSSIIFTTTIYTRLYTIIPLSLIIIPNFLKLNFYQKVIFTSTFMILSFCLMYLVFIQVPDYETLITKNPFSLQNRQNPIFLSVLFIIIPLFYSIKIKTLKEALYSSIFFLSLPVISSFLIRLFSMGWERTIYQSGTDISYFNILMPFLILVLASETKD